MAQEPSILLLRSTVTSQVSYINPSRQNSVIFYD